ncbi:secretion protein HlyD [Erwinia sp. OLTSP20]|uniref:HlyD family secretion protein n=1 Tax=unclassified Erwinia TaxID=2622719 RepID=UPI000C1A6E9D|nr:MULTISPECIES: efflux RND transporter periplasmic adaptor subunit [unclassified Erwinia]PIJ51017.1 secretion protein HlyD [Erwinia sp. OAMSP11]PIJ73715.1 secretion protein HlyD [Erwinia sp. OLSSP12]PIJ83072.1 secretion protein HlyD [Erwinia sp. OLCASP19]PIJ85670.1 secretion protein HlyD [Erwinia sp. OLMTSP26]PIJ87680.1 secretion protein HlyD [Erwinia sp. OLMDSP33]
MKKTTFLTLLFMIIVVALAVLFRAHSDDLLLQGEVDAPEVIVTSKAKGRVVERFVHRGDDVKAGQPLMRLSAPELIAQLGAAQATRDQAAAQLKMSLDGTRKESLRNLRAQWLQAQAKYQDADAIWKRDNAVAAKGYVSAQALETARQNRESAWQAMRAAEASLDEGIHGDRIEQREGYAAALRAAEQQLHEVEAVAEELNVHAPVAGEVGPIPAEDGELLNASSPLLTLVRLSRAYFVFDLREDILAHVRKGDKVKMRVPALGNKEIEAEVRYIAPLGDYATRRATRATGDFDLKTFEVRLYPLEPVSGLRQGMSALWSWKY